jgi:Tol biopolymer transport system component
VRFAGVATASLARLADHPRFAGLVFPALLAGFAAAQSTERVSLSSSGVESDDNSFLPSISADGRWVAFHSVGTNLVPGDTNGALDVFLRDRLTGQTTILSVSMNGSPGRGSSYLPSISADGSRVAFVSDSRILVPGDTNDAKDIFVRDVPSSTTLRASVDSAGNQGNGNCFRPSLSADGRWVAFASDATNLVPADTNGATDVFVHDLQTGITVRASVDSSGEQANGASRNPSISADGRFVAFESVATNLVSGDTNHVSDVFVHDLQTGSTDRVSLDSAGAQALFASTNPCLSAGGRTVAFVTASPLVASDTNGLQDVYVRDLQTGALTRASTDSSGTRSNGDSSEPALSSDGRFVAFTSNATNLVANDTNGVSDVFLHDLLSGETRRISVDSTGTEADDSSAGAALSTGGLLVAFWSAATNLVANDANGVADVFVRDLDHVDPVATCPGDGSAAPCPCSNSGSPGYGCENSFATGGGALGAGGSASLSADTLDLLSWGEPVIATSAFLQGSASTPPARLGDGLSCLGGAVRRLFVETVSFGSASAPGHGEPPISRRSAALGDVIPIGGMRFYQVLYRDPGSSFCPPPAGGAWNLTNGVAVVWAP